MKNLKTTIITALLLLAMVSGAVAQEKWEYAVVYYQYGVKVVKHSVETFPHQKGLDIQSEVSIKVEELNKEGWEVYNTTADMANGGTVGHIYYLRRKLKD